ncbi:MULTISPECIES: class I SAM-dependent methyltransferase [Halorhodospira]|uniref:class I SAM-dependent methyltransferase n=1 Tax=Halorhodospira TaxID=85108 RepID=UPI0019117AE2|nr:MULTISPECIES: class I SAM-dependent methyltransferase [Halorhodospira]MBK5943899.1 hypothetical protein [Halorhodospira halophila]MCG5539210.1 methyltransferase domain-containing protein [Halorhodospira sp. 9622]MCG5539573.1 methyltransferase domain-containing protein [Halorhodospira sp. M39old]MCG5545383.1 methyltransferase domain-containing protein [Halorhodospira sp. M38]
MQNLHAWYGTPLGQRVGAAERGAVADALAHLGIGDTVCIGPVAHPLPLAPTVRQWRVGPGGDLVATPQQLPFRGHSVDAVILSHVLEFGEEPAAVLSEAYQVLAPEGRLVVLTFNPLGLWGVCRLWGWCRSSRAPWRGRQWPASSVGVHLRRCGFETLARHSLCFRLPMQGERLQKRLDPWEDRLRRLGRFAAGVQMTVAVRREPGSLRGHTLVERVGRGARVGAAHPAGRVRVQALNRGGSA